MSRHQCPDCGFIFDEKIGDAHNGYPAGTRWELLPEDYNCPDCAVRDKPDFIDLDDADA